MTFGDTRNVPLLARLAAEWWDESPMRTHSDVARWLNSEHHLIVNDRWVADNVAPLTERRPLAKKGGESESH